MSVCSNCFDSGIIVDYCNEGITFGVVPADATYVVDIKHNATGKIQTFYGSESDVDGMLTIVGAKIDPLQGYTISLRGCEVFTICEVEYTCITFSVVNSNADAEDVGVINLIDCIEC
jgi:hypothetical protein